MNSSDSGLEEWTASSLDLDSQEDINLPIPEDIEDEYAIEESDMEFTIKKKSKKKKSFKNEKNANKANKRPWTDEEAKAVRQHLSKNFLLKTLPGKKQCDECIEKSGGIYWIEEPGGK